MTGQVPGPHVYSLHVWQGNMQTVANQTGSEWAQDTTTYTTQANGCCGPVHFTVSGACGSDGRLSHLQALQSSNTFCGPSIQVRLHVPPVHHGHGQNRNGQAHVWRTYNSHGCHHSTLLCQQWHLCNQGLEHQLRNHKGKASPLHVSMHITKMGWLSGTSKNWLTWHGSCWSMPTDDGSVPLQCPCGLMLCRRLMPLSMNPTLLASPVLQSNFFPSHKWLQTCSNINCLAAQCMCCKTACRHHQQSTTSGQSVQELDSILDNLHVMHVQWPCYSTSWWVSAVAIRSVSRTRMSEPTRRPLAPPSMRVPTGGSVDSCCGHGRWQRHW